MKWYLDSADVKTIEYYTSNYTLAGVTCNPAIIIKDKGDIKDLVKTVPKNLELYLEVLALDYKTMIDEAKYLTSLSPNVIVKIPATPEGLIAIRTLRRQGMCTLATAIYSVNQALMAANCGAAWVAPYVNRINNLEMNGEKTAIDIQNTFRLHSIDCKVIAASFKNIRQVQDLLVAGVDGVTVSADLFEKCISNPNAILAAEEFADAWEAAYGTRTLL